MNKENKEELKLENDMPAWEEETLEAPEEETSDTENGGENQENHLEFEGAAEETDASTDTEDADGGSEEKTPDAAGNGKEGQSAEKKSFFGKKKDKKDSQIEELTDRLKRNMAEFDNYRKRTEKEKSAMYEVGARDIIEKILPVIDNFERGLSTVAQEEKASPFAEGMDKIYRQLMKTLEEAGVKVIEAVGQPFDPNFHNAVMHVEDEELGENMVAEEFQRGYLYRDTVVRHSMVKVAN